MRLLHYLEIQNFKHFGEKQRIELDHPAVLIGPNNCGKTTAIQAIALWSQAVKTWFETKGKSPPKEKTATSLNRLSIVSVPVRSTRYFWHNANVRKDNQDILLSITVGVLHRENVQPVTMNFRNRGGELVYCTPDAVTLENPGAIEAAAELSVGLLYPMSGIETEEPILQPGRIEVLLGQGQTAQVLRNLCLIVFKDSPNDWRRIVELMSRLFSVEIQDPAETVRGSIDLFYRQDGVREPLDISLAGRGLQQMLLIFAYLYSHRRSVLLIDEPDAHLEILRQRQVYALLREVAEQSESQAVLVTHSEAILDDALDHNLTLLLGEQADNLAAKTGIRNALKHYGTEHYIRARQRGYVLYVEGRTDLDALKALAHRLDHPVARKWDQRINVFAVQNNYPDADSDVERQLERVEGGFGVTPRKHFFALRSIVDALHGLAILDNDGGAHTDSEEGNLKIVYWGRYEIENYFVTPETLLKKVSSHNAGAPLLLDDVEFKARKTLDALILERIFDGQKQDFAIWNSAGGEAARLLWEARTRHLKLSDFAEEFFRRFAKAAGHAMLLRKNDLHRLVDFVDPPLIPEEVREKLTLLEELFDHANP